MKRKKKKTSNRVIQQKIHGYLSRFPKKRLNAKELIKKLKLNANKDSVQFALEQLSQAGRIFQTRDRKYKLAKNPLSPKSTSNHIGKVAMVRSGAAFIICDDLESDVFVPIKHLNSALNGDTVEVIVREAKGRRPDGKIVRVVKRQSDRFLGTVHLYRKYAVVIPDNNRIPVDIMVAFPDLNEAEDGDKVVVKVTNWEAGKKNMPQGRITSVLGQTGTSDLEMKGILINKGFDIEFAPEVMRESAKLKLKLTPEELKARKDFRNVFTITIDPDTAKDFDDAISLKYLNDGQVEVGIHIADVTHYVKPKTELDKEAFRRSTSVYLVDRVAPMLPEEISNHLCSLVPNEDRFTFSAVFRFDKGNNITKRWFGKTIIHSDRRFTYEEAQEVLEGTRDEYKKELRKLNQVAKKLRKDKFKNGAIAFESDEVKFKLDEDGTPIGVFVKERKDAHLLVEDFMLLANKEVAAYMAKKEKGAIPFVYRIHDLPDPEKVEKFSSFALELGVKMKTDSPEQIAKSFNSLIKKAQNDPALKILQSIAIRSMAKAEYNIDNIGHYGLSFDYYTHFTSPIRRYSDVLVHRILQANLTGNKKWNKTELQDQCKHISAQERKAMEAERESIKYKQVEYMKKFIGKTFKGQISGIIARGMFVELTETRSEGLLGFETMKESFEIIGSGYMVKGKRTGKIYRLGDTISVRVADANLEKRTIDLILSKV